MRNKSAGKRKQVSSSRDEEIERKKKHRHNAGSVAAVTSEILGKSLSELPPLAQSYPVDPRFGAVRISQELTRVIEGTEEKILFLSRRNENLKKDLAAAEAHRKTEAATAQENEKLLLQQNADFSRQNGKLSDEIKKLREESAGREKLLADRERELASCRTDLANRAKDLKDVREALDLSSRNHGQLIKAFFCKIITTRDFSHFASSLARSAFGEITKRLLDRVMLLHPDLDLKDKKKYGYVDATHEETARAYAEKILSPPHFALVDELVRRAESGPLTPEIIENCEVILDTAVAGQKVNYGAGVTATSQGSTSQTTGADGDVPAKNPGSNIRLSVLENELQKTRSQVDSCRQELAFERINKGRSEFQNVCLEAELKNLRSEFQLMAVKVSDYHDREMFLSRSLEETEDKLKETQTSLEELRQNPPVKLDICVDQTYYFRRLMLCDKKAIFISMTFEEEDSSMFEMFRLRDL